MFKLKSTLLRGVLAASFALFPVAGFAAVTERDGMSQDLNGKPKTEMNEEMPTDQDTLPGIEKTAGRIHFGVYYGRPYYYRPYYYYYPYRPYYNNYYYYPYRPYGGYYWY